MGSNEFDDFEKNLVCFLRLYQNRYHHLSKYLIENNCLSQEFIENIKSSKKLSDLSQKYELQELPNIYFSNFKEMNKFFDNLSTNYNFEGADTEKISEQLNSKLEELLKNERYEEAIKIRDYMIQNNIKRNS